VRKEVAEEWGSWLDSFPWDWWSTLTFAEPYSPEAATRAFHRWNRRLARPPEALGGPPRYFVAHEIGGLGRLHLHALLGGLAPGSRRDQAWSDWFTRHGRAQILPFDPGLGATHYVAKYVTKSLAYYDIG
jgi:hypothetical protein